MQRLKEGAPADQGDSERRELCPILRNCIFDKIVGRECFAVSSEDGGSCGPCLGKLTQPAQEAGCRSPSAADLPGPKLKGPCQYRLGHRPGLRAEEGRWVLPPERLPEQPGDPIAIAPGLPEGIRGRRRQAGPDGQSARRPGGPYGKTRPLSPSEWDENEQEEHLAGKGCPNWGADGRRRFQREYGNFLLLPHNRRLQYSWKRKRDVHVAVVPGGRLEGKR